MKHPRHRVAAEKARRKLMGPSCPEELAYLWAWFRQAAGAEELTYSELDAFFRLRHIEPEPAEVEVLRRIDEIRRVVSRETDENDA